MITQSALVVGASGGIGQALASEYQNRGVKVTRLSRRHDNVDVTVERDLSHALGGLQQTFDTVIVATGILSDESGPEKSIRSVTAEQMARVFAVNAIGPLLVLKHAARLLPRNRPSVFAALSARVGSIGDNALGGWYSYRASKAALNQIIKSASIELRRTHKKHACVALHPGTVATDFTRNYPDCKKVPAEEAARKLIAVIDGLSPSDTGNFLDWAGETVPW